LNKIPDIAPSPLQEITTAISTEKGVRLFFKRDDLLHPVVSGNKWRKLRYNLLAAREQGKKYLITFGGAYSNHIQAVAAASQYLGFQSIGLIRGEEPLHYGATLAFAKSKGMELRFLSRSAYRNKEVPADIDLSVAYLLPEGGTNALAIKGCGEIVEELLEQLEVSGSICLCVPCGTGGTLSGIIQALTGKNTVIGFSALKGDFLEAEIKSLHQQYQLAAYHNWSVNNHYHFGGYARFHDNLVDFVKTFYAETGIPLDPVYTAKMTYGVLDLLSQNYFPRGCNIVLIHTGGLQGVIGFNERFGCDLPGGLM
jgi:1-aminocyclopropane-1-carboxylate deaminase